MALNPSEVKVGLIYITANNQLRKVASIDDGEGGRKTVQYDAKSANIKQRPFQHSGGTQSNPTLLKTFCEDCDHELSKDEISALIADGVILKGEYDAHLNG